MTQTIDRKQRILDCALAVILRDGIAGLTIRKVADAAAVSTGLVLHHFVSKDGLIESAWGLVLSRLGEKAVSSVGEIGGIEWMDAIYRGRFHERDESSVSEIFWLEYWLHAARTPRLRLHHSETYAAMRQRDLKRVTAGVTSGEIRGDLDPSLIADMYHVLACGLAVKVVLDHESITRERAYELSQLFLSLIAPHPPAVTGDPKPGPGTRRE